MVCIVSPPSHPSRRAVPAAAGAEKIFSLTGATAGCLLCYIIPVVCHLRLYFFGGCRCLPCCCCITYGTRRCTQLVPALMGRQACFAKVLHCPSHAAGMRRRKKQVIPKVRVPLLEDLDSGHVPWSDPLIDDWLVGKVRRHSMPMPPGCVQAGACGISRRCLSPGSTIPAAVGK